MPSPQDGKAGALVPPAAPTAATDADDAQPGAVEEIKAEQRQTRTGKYGSQPVTPFQKAPPSGDSAKPTHFIAIKLVDEDGNPVPGETYKIVMPDQSVAEGTLDAQGAARVDGIPDAGECQVSFPRLDAACWKPA